jgi:hypothetical protein
MMRFTLLTALTLIAAPTADAQLQPRGMMGLGVMGMPICADPSPVVGDTTGLGLTPARHISIVLPPMPPNHLIGQSMTTRYLINPLGRIDSIEVTGISDSAFIAEVKAAMLKWAKFHPGHTNGCRLSTWTGWITATFSR